MPTPEVTSPPTIIGHVQLATGLLISIVINMKIYICMHDNLIIFIWYTGQVLLLRFSIFYQLHKANIFIHDKLYYRLSHDVVIWNVDRDVSTVYCYM